MAAVWDLFAINGKGDRDGEGENQGARPTSHRSPYHSPLQGSTAGQERQGVRRVLGYGGYYDYGYYCSKRVERQVGEQGRLVPPQASA